MRALTTFYDGLVSLGNRSQVIILAIVLLVLRLVWGFEFFRSGLGKWNDIPSVIHFFQTLAIPFPSFNAYFVGTLELVGGLLLFIGLCSRLVGLLLAVNMLVAYATAHTKAVRMIFSEPSLIVDQDPFWFLVTALFVFAFGPGLFSVDALLKRYVFKGKKQKNMD